MLPTDYILGIDPGLSGAFAFVTADGCVCWRVYDIESSDGRVMPGGLVEQIKVWQPKAAVIERVGSRPGQGVASTFKFGRAYGCVEGVVETLGISHGELTPAQWKRTLGLGKDKGAARAEAQRRWPTMREAFARSKDAGRAEAALLVVAWLKQARVLAEWGIDDA